MLAMYFGVWYDKRQYSILNPWRPLSWIISSPIIFVQNRVAPFLRFIYSWASKLILRHRRAYRGVQFEVSEPYFPSHYHIISNPKLQRILNIEHVLLNIVENMCYEDVINLSLTSRAVREAVYPCCDLELRVPKLKQYSCESLTKKPCIYCNKNICSVCIFFSTLVAYCFSFDEEMRINFTKYINYTGLRSREDTARLARPPPCPSLLPLLWSLLFCVLLATSSRLEAAM